MPGSDSKEKGVIISKLQTFPIVAIGASAGGLEAITVLLKNLPSNTGAAFVFITHLNRNTKSSLTDILQRETEMKVSEVTDNMILQPDQLFIIPPNTNMELNDGKFVLSTREDTPAKHSPIDKFFLSISANRTQSIIAVILSGTAHDGTIGMKAIKTAGGFTFVQNNTAAFLGMPLSALAEEGTVDAALSPKEIAAEIVRLTQTKDLLKEVKAPPLEEDGEAAEDGQDVELLKSLKDEDIKTILTLVRSATTVDFTNYKPNTIRRRILRRMVLNKKDNLEEYIQLLEVNSNEVVLLYQDLLINVTHFFRDPEAIDFLRRELLPELLEQKSIHSPLRIWVPACSTGQEAYTLAIIILEILEEKSLQFPVQIFATDLSEIAIAKARVAMYSIDEVSFVPAPLLNKYFTRVDGHYRIIKKIRDLCVFAPHNVINDLPFSRVDIISCCNLMIYLDAKLQAKLLSNFHYSLNKKGILVLGKAETVAASAHLFYNLDKKVRIYSKKSEVQAKGVFEIHPTINKDEPVEQKLLNAAISKEQQPENIERAIDHILLKSYTPAAVVVNYDLDIVHFRGSTSLFLEPTPGKATLNLLKMARRGLELDLRNATMKVIKTGDPVKVTGIDINYRDLIHHLEFEVTNLISPTKDKFLLIVFEEAKTPSPADLKNSFSKDRRVKQLEAELLQLREDMRSITEEQGTANEELQSTNEEIVSSNEELQIINEELETSKEELESSNEELMTINQELQVRNNQLAEAQEYTENVIALIREAVIVLDRNFHVKTANNAFYQTFKIQANEAAGKLIFEIGNGQWNIPNLHHLLEVQLTQDHEILDYELVHTFEGIGEKVLHLNAKFVSQIVNNQFFIILSIEDITKHKQAEKLVEEREQWLSNMANNVPVMLWVATPDKNFNFVNKTWEAFTGRNLATEIGIGWTEGIFKEDTDLVLRTFHASFQQHKPFSIEHRLRKFDGEYRWVLNTAVPTFDNDGSFTGYTGSCVEIHDKRLLYEELENMVKERTHELENANLNLERSNSELAQFAYVASHDLQEPLRKITTFTTRLQERFSTSLSDQAIELVNKISSSSVRMRTLIDDLLNFSRISKFEKNFIVTDLNKVFKDVLTDFDLSIQEKNVLIQAGKLPVVKAIPLQMNQLFYNLVNNAIKFSRSDSQPMLAVTCEKASKEQVKKFPKLKQDVDYFEIIFTDNGIGFSEEFADQIFVIFQRLNEKVDYPGTGIGLALCRKIVRNHGGEIFAKSEEGKGSQFHIILPVEPKKEDILSSLDEEIGSR